MNDQVFRTVSMKLDGLDIIWNLSIFNRHELIRKRCYHLITDLYLYSEKGNCIERGKNNMMFFETWLDKIKTIDQNDQESKENLIRLLYTFVIRYDGYHMDSVLFEKYDWDLEIDMDDNTKSSLSKKHLKISREMTIGAIRNRIGDAYNIIPSEVLILSSPTYISEICMNDKLSAYKDCRNINIRRRTIRECKDELPRYLVASQIDVINEVIDKGLKSSRHDLRCETLQFLDYISLNYERMQQMISCEKLNQKNDLEDWCSFLYSDDIYSPSIYYGLKIMQSILV